MNIFVLDSDPVTAAKLSCDKHVVKMILESAQLLCSPFPQGDAPYRRTHYNHPCSVWARESVDNYKWLIRHAYGLGEEYTYRYGKTHKSLNVVNWCNENHHSLKLPKKGLTKFAQAMPEEYRTDDVVTAYQTYYQKDKHGIATWKRREVPSFMKYA